MKKAAPVSLHRRLSGSSLEARQGPGAGRFGSQRVAGAAGRSAPASPTAASSWQGLTAYSPAPLPMHGQILGPGTDPGGKQRQPRKQAAPTIQLPGHPTQHGNRTRGRHLAGISRVGEVTPLAAPHAVVEQGKEVRLALRACGWAAVVG